MVQWDPIAEPGEEMACHQAFSSNAEEPAKRQEMY